MNLTHKFQNCRFRLGHLVGAPHVLKALRLMRPNALFNNRNIVAVQCIRYQFFLNRERRNVNEIWNERAARQY